MIVTFLLAAASVFAGVWVPPSAVQAASVARADAASGTQAPHDLAPQLELLRAEHGVVALAGAVVVGGEVRARGAVGRRRSSGPETVTVDDRWHIGSCGKARRRASSARRSSRTC